MLALTQSEQRLQSANETLLNLASYRDWWQGLDSAEHLKASNVSRLVDKIEHLIEGYIASSLSALKSALDDEDEDENKGGAHEKRGGGEELDNSSGRMKRPSSPEQMLVPAQFQSKQLSELLKQPEMSNQLRRSSVINIFKAAREGQGGKHG